MEWIELSLPAGELADEVAALIASTDEVAARGVEVRGADVVLWAPAGEADAAAEALRAAAVRLRAEGFPVDPATVRVRPAPPEDEWRDAWKRHFTTTRVGRRLLIAPSWEQATATPAPDDLVMRLDPGRAFGTGSHPTTRLCLVELERLRDEGLAVRRFLDVGTGSGILSIAAALLWPDAAGVAIDVDPQATSAARENLAENGLQGRVRVGEDAVEDVGGAFEVVVANVQADVLFDLAPAIAARVAPGGALVLSGLLAWQAEPVAARYAALGLAIARTERLADDLEWSAVVARRPEAGG